MKKPPPKQNLKPKSDTGKSVSFHSNPLFTDKTTLLFAFGFIILLCFACYGNTLRLKYAYDDLMVVTGNQFTKQGIHGIGNIFTTDYFTGFFGKDKNMVAGGRYRPLSLLTFALEYQFFGENPLVSHLVNVLLFSAICLLLFVLLLKLAASGGYYPDKKSWYFSAPFLITLLFAAHPVHTEVVANIKSRDELLALLLCLTTLYVSLKFLEERKKHLLLVSGAGFFLALLSKENAATFLVIQAVTIFIFTRNKISDNLISLLPLLVSTLLFLFIRQAVIGTTTIPLADDLMNNPFVEMSLPQKYATILYTLGLYLKLLLFPHPLTCDYYPYHIPIIHPSDLRALFPLAVYLAMIIYIFLKIRKKSLVAYCFLFFLVTISIASNILFPIGAFMNERFLFIPSLAFCILLGSGIPALANRVPLNPGGKKILVASLMAVILSLYAFKTVSRNADWYDSYTLFTTDVKVSSNSAKGNEVAGEYIMQKALTTGNKVVRDSLLRQSIAYQRKAITVYPKQIIALFNLAAAYYEYDRNYDTILAVYKTILHFLPDNPQVYGKINSILYKYDNVDHKIMLYKDLQQVNPGRWDININLGLLYLNNKKDPATALPYLARAATLNTGDYDTQKFLGIAYALLHQWSEAARYMERAESINPGEAALNRNLAIVYTNLGEPGKAREALARVQKGKMGK
ncbi:MAG: tetratricopeptide repeat protein [Bacteroidota bacterium]